MSTLRKAGLTGFFLFCMAPSFCEAETATRLALALQAEPSATKVLQDYCRLFAPGLAITAIPLPTNNRPAPALLYERFALGPNETLKLRHVSLRCGDLVLSDAWNWYVPSRLAPSMRHLLDTTTLPFGRVVAALNFKRTPLLSETHDLPPNILLRNTAMLTRGEDGKPFSLVVETYPVAGFTSLTAAGN